MSFPRYRQYKDSGVEWLGEVPEHWEVGPLRRSIEFLTDYEANGSFADTKENVAIDTGEPYAWYVRATDLEQRRFGLVEGNRFCDQATFNWLTKTSLRGGELLVAKRGEIGKVYVMPTYGGNATLAPNLYLIRLKQNLQPRYAWYWFSVDPGKAELVLADKSTTIGALYKDDVKSCFVATPSTAEQTRIVEFLDRETGKIDELVAEQQRLMELLKEKRQAVISHAVTKGLNPRAPMKPSGIEWLGDVPAHWAVGAIKHFTETITDGAHVSPETEDGIYPFVSTKDVLAESIDLEGCLRTSASSYQYMVKTGCKPKVADVLFSKDGTIGRTVVVTKPDDFVVASSLIIVRPNRDILSSKFLNRLCQSGLVTAQVDSFVKGAGLPRLSIQNLLKVVGCFPPPAEQACIAEYVDREVGKIDALSAEAHKAIDLLQERRTALISAAVTGQIDVRKLAVA